MALTLNNTLFTPSSFERPVAKPRPLTGYFQVKKPLPYLPQEMWNKIMYFKDVSEHNDLTKMLVKEIKTERAKDRGFNDPHHSWFRCEKIAQEIAEEFPLHYEEGGNFYTHGFGQYDINGERYFGCKLGESEYAYETEPWRYTHNGKIINID